MTIATGADDDRLVMRTNLFEERVRILTRLGADTLIAEANFAQDKFTASGGLSRSDSIAIEASSGEDTRERGFENEMEAVSEMALDALAAIDEAIIDFSLI